MIEQKFERHISSYDHPTPATTHLTRFGTVSEKRMQTHVHITVGYARGDFDAHVCSDSFGKHLSWRMRMVVS